MTPPYINPACKALTETMDLFKHSTEAAACCYSLFVKTKNKYNLGDDVFLLMSLMEEEKFPVTGKVVWITPIGAGGVRNAGIGVQFSEDRDMEVARTKIESLLAPFKGDKIATQTM